MNCENATVVALSGAGTAEDRRQPGPPGGGGGVPVHPALSLAGTSGRASGEDPQGWLYSMVPRGEPCGTTTPIYSPIKRLSVIVDQPEILNNISLATYRLARFFGLP